MRNTRLDITVAGETERDGLLKSVNERYGDAEAAVVLTWKRHNDHVVIEQGIILGEFSRYYYEQMMQALVGSWGRWDVIRALFWAILRPKKTSMGA